jgi:hypothetical protein
MRAFVLPGILAASLLAQQRPDIQNARLQTQTVQGELGPAFRTAVNAQISPGWIAYVVPAVDRHNSCCQDGQSGCVCALEQEGGHTTNLSNQVKLEGQAEMLVLYRTEHRQVGRIAFFSAGCGIDAGGLPVHLLQSVSPAGSVRLLGEFARSGGSLRDPAVAAIALHRDPSADGMLESFVAANQPEELRKKAVFWLGSARGRRGYEILDNLLRADSSPEVRSQAIFALSISPDPDALKAMIRAAHDDGSAHVRGQALFWLAQKAQKKAAVDAIWNAAENDPETDVKKQAVFALSQMPPEKGTPLLIHLAETNRNREVRKQAMFWLGQSRDPRALQFFEQVLTK